MTTSKDNFTNQNAMAPSMGSPVDKVLVVDIGKRQSKKRIKNLREGRGALFNKVLETLTELKADGTIDASAKPVVIVVRERPKSAGGFFKLG
jgi:hypothetical protein